MELTARQTDRAAGVILGQACGDALGVPYEFGRVPESPAMVGGGLGPYAPGEWSDDTQMAVCIARVAATGANLAAPEALDEIADAFLGWVRGGASDVGIQTSRVLAATRRSLDDGDVAAVMTREARRVFERGERAAGNGALMRTSIVGLSALTDPLATADRARAVASLTHGDPLAGDSAVLWSELIRQSVLGGAFDLASAIALLPESRRGQWREWTDAAVASAEPARFSPNGFTVTALQAALAAVTLAARSPGARGLRDGLVAAVRAGDDTDTVAAIAGGLLGALHGASAVPVEWRRIVHGWPGLRARDLVGLAVATARGGRDDARWPHVPEMDYSMQWDAGRLLGVAHPHDDGVVIGTLADLERLDELGVDAVVSLCRRGTDQVPAPGVRPQDHVEMWLLDSDDPADHGDLDAVLDDAADAIARLRQEGRRVLVHCVAAQQRAPSVAACYSIRLGVEPEQAARDITAAVPWARGHGLLWRTALGR